MLRLHCKSVHSIIRHLLTCWLRTCNLRESCTKLSVRQTIFVTSLLEKIKDTFKRYIQAHARYKCFIKWMLLITFTWKRIFAHLNGQCKLRPAAVALTEWHYQFATIGQRTPQTLLPLCFTSPVISASDRLKKSCALVVGLVCGDRLVLAEGVAGWEPLVCWEQCDCGS